MFYLGNKVKDAVPHSTKQRKNQDKTWEYGYNAEYDIVIISKDGTVGEIYDVFGIKIGLPLAPERKTIRNYGKPTSKQKWTREEIPEGLNIETMDKDIYTEYLIEQFEKRENGVWVYINGKPIYITGTYWFGLQWCRESTKYPVFRVIQNELMIFWEACKADYRCYGMQYVKNRRFGASFLSIIELVYAAIQAEDKLLGIVSKKGDDSKKIFRRLVKVFRRLPCFFQPIWDGTNNPKTELVLEEPTKRRSKGEKITEGSGLGTLISWHNTDLNAMDGDEILRSLLDECFGKGTKILMSDMTFKSIEDIVVDDEVIVEEGRIKKVVKTIYGETEMFKVSQPYGIDYTVSKNHRLYLEQRCKVKGIHDDGIKIMTPDEYLALGKYKTRTTFGVRSKGLEFDRKEVKIDPYMMGLWLGDGFNDQSLVLVNTQDDKEIAEYITEYCIENKFLLNIRDTSSDICKKYCINRDKEINIKTNRFRRWLKHYNVFKNKHVPTEYLLNDRVTRLELLAGLLDSDGHLMNTNNCYRYELVSSDSTMFDGYLKLIRSLGFKVGVRKKKTNFNTIVNVATIYGDVSQIPCKVERKKVPKTYKRAYADHINKIDIESIGLGKFYGITLEAHNDDDRRLILEDFTISMNCGKYPKNVPIDEYWPIVKTSHTDMGSGVGKAMLVSTVNSSKHGGLGFKNIWIDSDVTKRNDNDETISGLYRIFIPADFGLAGFYDEFGFSIVENPEKAVTNEFGKPRTVGSKAYLDNVEKSLESEPEKLNERKRQYPRNDKDPFRDKSDDCDFNGVKIQEQLDHNEHELEDKWDSHQEFIGNNDLERGNFRWEDGIRDTKVIWYPDPENGRFFIKKGCHPPSYYRNKFEMKYANGILGKSPLAGLVACGGVDPYNRSKNADGKGSKGAYHLSTGFHTCEDLPINTCIVEYIARPKKIELFFEDMIMVSVYYSVPFLCELSNERFLAMVKERGYRNFSKNNPYKKYRDLNPTEKEFGGAPAQDSKIGEGQFYITEAFVDDHLGVARDERFRMIGDMGDFPFSRTLIQLKEVDTSNRTDYDAYISFSLSRIGISGNLARKERKTNKQPISLLDRYDNSGLVSSIM